MNSRVLECMEKLGITMNDLSEQMGVSKEYLWDRFEGKHPFTLDEAWKLKCLLQMDESIESLFGFFMDKM